MSRIGRAPIAIPAGVEVKIDGNHISVKGPKGTLERDVDPAMILELEGNTLHVKRPNDEKRSCAMHGLTRTLVNDMVVGVTQGFSKALEIQGRNSLPGSQSKPFMRKCGDNSFHLDPPEASCHAG